MKKYFIAVLCGLITACASLPLDTLNKRLAAFEVAYEQALVTVGIWIKENRLSVEQKEQVQGMIKKISDARQAIYIAKGLQNMKEAQTQLTNATAALKLLRELLALQDKGAFKTNAVTPRQFKTLLNRRIYT